MKVRQSVKRLRKFCKIVKRKGAAKVVCKDNPNHKQRQKGGMGEHGRMGEHVGMGDIHPQQLPPTCGL